MLETLGFAGTFLSNLNDKKWVTSPKKRIEQQSE